MKKFLAIAAMIIIGTFISWGEDVVAQTPLASCNSCGTSGWELYVGGTYTTFDHWYDGTSDAFKDLKIYSGQRPGHQFKLTTALEIPLRWEFITSAIVGVDYFSREHENILIGGYENILTGYDWNQEGLSFSLGFKIKLGG